MSKILYIDGDILLYRVGFSVEKRDYLVTFLDSGRGEIFKTKAEIKEAKIDEPIGIESRQQFNCDFPKLEVAVRLQAIVDTIKKRTKCEDYSICLSSETPTFRQEDCKLIKYKDNRTHLKKPLLFKYVLQRIIDKHPILRTEGLEADDVLGMHAGSDSVIASIDKDLLMVPGTHYNINSGDIIHSTDPGSLWLYRDKGACKKLSGYGFRWFCAQMLLGDAIDNIPGIKGYGPVKVFNTLSDIEDKESMWEAVCRIYDDSGKSAWIEETARMLWIWRKENDTYRNWL